MQPVSGGTGGSRVVRLELLVAAISLLHGGHRTGAEARGVCFVGGRVMYRDEVCKA